MSIRKNTLYNILGAGLPTFVSLITIPLYLKVIGDARYGVLAIVWLLLGYFSVFDLGLSRATTNQIARLNNATVQEREGVFWTALTLNGILGTVGGLVLYFVAKPLMLYAFTMPDSLRNEVVSALPIIAATVPVATMTGVFSGALGARERFATMNIIQSLGTLLFQVAPLLAAFVYGTNLELLIAVTVGARIISALPFIPAVKKTLPLCNPPKFERHRVRELLNYGAWVTVSNLLTPLLTAIDRFIIAALSGASAVAYYSVPYNLANRVSILPAALASALFPQLSMTTSDRARDLTNRSLQIVAAVMTPLVIIGIFVIRPFLDLWVGKAFSLHAAPVGLLVLLGVWSKGLSFIPYNLLEARGRPDLIAKLHGLEFVVYVPVLWFSIVSYGLEGAALSWSILILIDMMVLCRLAGIDGQSILIQVVPFSLFLVLSSVIAFSHYNYLVTILTAVLLLLSSLTMSFYSSILIREYYGFYARKLLLKTRRVFAR